MNRVAPTMVAALCLLSTTAMARSGPQGPPPPVCVSDYDAGTVYWLRAGRKQPIHGMCEPWVFNRSMVWLDAKAGADGAVICYSSPSPLLLTGRRGVSRWYTAKANRLSAPDDELTRFEKRDPAADVDHASLPPLEFHVEQNPTAELEVTRASHPWQLLIVVKGRSGPPLYVSPWQAGPGKLTVDVRKLYRRKGYGLHFAELQFALATWTAQPGEEATVDFRLRLGASAVVVASLPVIRTAGRAAREGVPICAVVLDRSGSRLGAEQVAVTAAVGRTPVQLSEGKEGIWKGNVGGLPEGEHTAALRATFKDGRREALRCDLAIRITDGQFLAYDPKLRLLTRAGKPIGPLTGSYRGHPMFKGIATAEESLLHGQQQWDARKGDRHEGQHGAHGGPKYGFHWWESLTEKELDADYAYLARCGWSVVHLCQGWWVWERLDAGGRIAPHGAEQLFLLLGAARRHGLHLHLALSHYPLGKQSAPYAQYLEAGYKPADYGDAGSKFHRMFQGYLGQFAAIFRDETAISAFTAAGEGDPHCGTTFVNTVHDFMKARDGNHLFVCEERRGDWKPVLNGLRTYGIDRKPDEVIPIWFKGLAARGSAFMAEGLFWGYSDGARQTQRYRQRVRRTFYTGLAYRIPILMSWEERVVEDERVVFDQVRRGVDWTTPFARPRLAIRGDKNLEAYERSLSRLPLEYARLDGQQPAPQETLLVINADEPFRQPAFVSDGGVLPDALKADMPLRLPSHLAASYSWSRDRGTLLAFIHRPAWIDAPAEPAPSLACRNFPAGKLPYRLFDLEAKKAVLEGELDGGCTLRLPAGLESLFLLVGGTAVAGR